MDKLWTVEEVAGYLNLTESAVRTRVSREQIPYVKLGSSLRFEPEAIRQFVRDNAVGVGSGELYGSGG